VYGIVNQHGGAINVFTKVGEGGRSSEFIADGRFGRRFGLTRHGDSELMQY